jgi:F0F1-type ATP synthase membrane subunit c/vacuolar-type H+-ATPase subunit K
VDGPQTYFTKYLIDTIEQGLHGCGDGLPLGAVFSHTADALARDKRPVPTHSVRHHADRFILARNVGGTEGELLPGPEKRRFGRRAILAAGLVVAIAVITLAMVILHTV